MLLFINSNGQAKINILINDLCNNTITPLECELKAPSGIKYNKRDSTGYFLLKEEGTYLMTALYLRGDFMHYIDTLIEVQFDSTINYTIILEQVYECTEWALNPTQGGFCKCNELCNGVVIDYYSNGNKRLEGNFFNGKPKGKLYFYNKDGSIKYIEKYSRNGKLKKVINSL